MDMGGGQMRKGSKVPTEDEFVAASEALSKRSLGLSEIRENVLQKFQNDIHEFFVFDLSERSFKAYVFLQWNWQLDKDYKSGIASEIEEFVLQQLEYFGRGKRDNLHLVLEFDSHENVDANFGGDYYSRLR